MTITETGCWEWQGYRLPSGYGQVSIYGKIYRPHRYAYELTYGPLEPGQVVCHRCDNPPCCNPEHLFVGTHADNVADRVQKGRSRTNPPKGEDSPGAKLTAKDVIAIRSRYATGDITQEQLAQEYNISPSVIWNIIHRRKWKHVQ